MHNIEIAPLKKEIYENPNENDFLSFKTNITYKSGFDICFSFEKFLEVDEESRIITEISKHTDFMAAKNIKFICDWMKNINKFPIYVALETDDFMANDLEARFDKIQIEYRKHNLKNDNIYFKVKIEEPSHLKFIISPVYMTGSWNNFAGWSFHNFDVSYEEIEGEYGGNYLNLAIDFFNPNSTLIWVSYDGHSLVILSNEDELSTLENVIKYFPKNTNIKFKEWS